MSDQTQTELRCGAYDRRSPWKLFRKWWPSGRISSLDVGLPPSLEPGEAWWLGLAAATWPGFVPAPLFVPYMSRLSQQPSKEPCKWTVSLDVAHFSPAEIFLSVKDGFVVVEGKHEERRDEHGFIARCFTRKYRLPGEIVTAEITATLSADGILTVEAPVPEESVPTVTVIPIKEKKQVTASAPNLNNQMMTRMQIFNSFKEEHKSHTEVELEETDKPTCEQTHEEEPHPDIDPDTTTAPQAPECSEDDVVEPTAVQGDQDQPGDVTAAPQQPEEKTEPEEEKEEEKEKEEDKEEEKKEEEEGDKEEDKAETDPQPAEDRLPSAPADDSDKESHPESSEQHQDLESQESPITDPPPQVEDGGESSQSEEIKVEGGSSEAAEEIPPEEQEQESVESPATEVSSQEPEASDIKEEHAE